MVILMYLCFGLVCCCIEIPHVRFVIVTEWVRGYAHQESHL
jgi:hypothetical protein